MRKFNHTFEYLLQVSPGIVGNWNLGVLCRDKGKMPVAVDLFPQIMSYNLDYQIIVDYEGNHLFPKRICKYFLFALQSGDDSLSTMIVKDARKKLKRAIRLIPASARMNHVGRYIPGTFHMKLVDGMLQFDVEGYADDRATEAIIKFLKPTTTISRKGISIEFHAPEQLQISRNGDSYRVEINEDKVASTRGWNDRYMFVSDWLFNFLVTGSSRGSQSPALFCTTSSVRERRYGKDPSRNSASIDLRNKRKKLRYMLLLWKEKHPTLLGRMDVQSILKIICRNEDINLHNAMYSL